MPFYPFECPACDTEFDLMMSISSYESGGQWSCESCNEPITKDNRIMTAANVTRASYVDGTVRSGFADNREITKLRTESYNLPSSERKEINKVIKKIERS